MKSITIEHIVMACILGMFIRDMVVEFKPKDQQAIEIKLTEKKSKDEQ